MRILLVRAAPVGRGKLGIVPAGIVPPLGILHISAYLKKMRPGDDVKILDASIDLDVPEDLEAIVDGFDPRIVGLSGLSQEAFHVDSLARASKTARPDVPVIVGGPIASAYSLGVLEHIADADAAVVGEGEETFVEVVSRIESGLDLEGVRGIAMRAEDGTPVQNEPRPFIESLDDLPPIDWSQIDIKAYNQTMNFAHVPIDEDGCALLMTSRGCPYSCTYCHKFFGKRVRGMSPGAVVSEMERTLDEYGIREFHLVDDIFNFKRGRIEAFCSEIERRGLKVRFSFPNGLRGDLLTEADVDTLASCGLTFVALAVETVTPRLQKMISKHLDVERVFEIVGRFVHHGILTRAFVMLGFPTETREEMEDTISQVVDSDFHMAMFFSTTPYPGTELFDIAVEHGFDPHLWVERKFTYDRDFVNTGTLPDEEFEQVLRQARRRFYTRPERLERLRSWLADNNVEDHPYIQNSSVWKMILESFSGGAWSQQPIQESPCQPGPTPRIPAGRTLAAGWKVESAGPEEVVLAREGAEPVTLLLSPRRVKSPCMLRTSRWNIGIRSDEPLTSLPRDLEEAIRALASLLDE